MLFFFQAEDVIRDLTVTRVQTCALPISFQVLPEVAMKVGSIPGVQTFAVIPPALPGGGNFPVEVVLASTAEQRDRKSTRLNSSHSQISYAVFCLKKKKKSRSRLLTATAS